MRRPSPSGGFRAILAAGAASAALAAAVPAPAAVVPTFTRVTQEGGIAADCTAPLPGGAGAASATYSHSAGIGTIQTNWSVPAQITAGAQVTLGLQVTATQALNGLILLNAPAEFGGAPAPFEVARSLGPAGGSASGTATVTFTPTRAFTAGETHILRIGNGCNAFLYEYVATGTPDPPAPTGPTIVPRTTRPVPGVVTSYAAPRPGRVLALPVPASGCAPPAATAGARRAAHAGGTCEAEVFLRRKGGKALHDPDAVFAVDARISVANLKRAQTLCFVHAIDLGANLATAGFDAANDRFRTCVIVIARILERRRPPAGARPGAPRRALVPDGGRPAPRAAPPGVPRRDRLPSHPHRHAPRHPVHPAWRGGRGPGHPRLETDRRTQRRRAVPRRRPRRRALDGGGGRLSGPSGWHAGRRVPVRPVARFGPGS